MGFLAMSVTAMNAPAQHFFCKTCGEFFAADGTDKAQCADCASGNRDADTGNVIGSPNPRYCFNGIKQTVQTGVNNEWTKNAALKVKAHRAFRKAKAAARLMNGAKSEETRRRLFPQNLEQLCQEVLDA